MHIGMLELLKPDKPQVIVGDLAALPVAEPRLSLQTEHDVSKDIKPQKQSRFLKHHEAMASRTCDQLIISQHAALIRLGQSRHDVEQRRFAAPARPNQTDDFSFFE